jgi:hypothetical protein
MLEASLHWAVDGRSDSDGSLAVIAEPLRTTEPFLCEVHLPEGTSQSRVRLWLLTHQGERAAETFVDVVVADQALIPD